MIGNGNDPAEGQPTYELVVPFVDDNVSFTRGVEVGIQYARMIHGHDKAFQQTVHTENQRQLQMMAKAVGWTVRFEPLDADWAEAYFGP